MSDYPLEVSAADALRLSQANGALIIDVREPHELEICRVEGAQPIPLRTLPAQIATLPRDRHLLMLCHVGGRSMRATQFLRAQGFAAVSNIAGGISAWADENDPAMPRY